MDAYVQELTSALLDEIHFILDSVIKMPDEVFRVYGLSGFTSQMYAEVIADSGAKAQSDSANDHFKVLCQSVPMVPVEAVKAISMAYAAVSFLQDSRADYPGDEDAMRTLLESSKMMGMAMGFIAADPKTSDATRRKMLSSAGRDGARARHKKTAELKEWALKEAKNIKKDDADIARALLEKVPHHLADASKDPERLIYDAIRLDRKLRLTS